MSIDPEEARRQAEALNASPHAAEDMAFLESLTEELLLLLADAWEENERNLDAEFPSG